MLDSFGVVQKDLAKFILEKKYKTIDIGTAKKSLKEQFEKKLSYFDCGDSKLNSYLREDALEEAIRLEDFGATTLVLNEENRVVAYCSILPSQIEFDTDDVRNCLQISFIGVDKDYKSKGIGEHLIKHVLHIAKQVGFRYVTLDSYPGKATWYAGFGFLCFYEEDEVKYFKDAVTKIIFSKTGEFRHLEYPNDFKKEDSDLNNLVYMYCDLIEEDAREFYRSLA